LGLSNKFITNIVVRGDLAYYCREKYDSTGTWKPSVGMHDARQLIS